MWERRRRLVRPEWDPTHNVWRAAADTLRSSPEDTAALAAASPLFAAHRGFQVLQEPAHAAPDPKGPFLPESDHLLFASWPPRLERGNRANYRPPRGLRPRMLPLHHAPPSSEAQNTRAFALNTPGSPRRAASVCCSWRCGSWCARPYNPHVFQSGAVRHPFPLGGRVDQAATTASRCVDVVMERSKSRADPERETVPSWVLRLEKPSP